MKSIRNIIIPHFDKYPLITSKNLDFKDFKVIVTMCDKDEHKKSEGMEIIKKIKSNMNKLRSFEQR
jgi:LAGLIDADG endonuclease